MTAAPWPTRRARAPTAAAAMVPVSKPERLFAAACFGLLLFANMALMQSKLGGVPVRGFLSIGMLALFVALYPALAMQVARRIGVLVALSAVMALQVSIVSLVNGAGFAVIVRQVSEIYLQMMVVLFVTVLLAQLAGLRAAMIAFVAAVALSAGVAALQFAHLDVGWQLRKLFGPLAKAEFEPFKLDRRPTGLAYSPIQLSTHLCLAFAVFTAARSQFRAARSAALARRADPAILIAIGAFVLACIVSETRSPILGVAIFLALYLAVKRSWWLLFAVVGGGFLALELWPLIVAQIEGNAPRVISTDDKSAAARLAFAYFGWRLFLDNPLGYGLTFDPQTMYHDYWADLYLMRGAQGVQLHDLHNYFLSMLNTHGIGILLFVPITIVLLRRAGGLALFFVPYVVHISFHNSGPFWNDSIIWFAVAALMAPILQPATAQAARPRPRRPRPNLFGPGPVATATARAIGP